MDLCPLCGFVFASVPIEQFHSEIADGGRACAEALRSTSPSVVAARPTPETWSTLEYGAHVRDVLLVTRDRVIVALVEENPGFAPIFRDQRVAFGIYDGEEPFTVADEIMMGSRLLNKTLDVISAEQYARPCVYSFPTPADRSIGFVVQNTIHELRHHHADMSDSPTPS